MHLHLHHYSSENPIPLPNYKQTLLKKCNNFFFVEEYISESKKFVTSPDLQPKLLCEEGLIQIGSGKHLFVLGFIIGAVENLDLVRIVMLC